MTAMILLRTFMESQIEFWLPVKGFEGYDVSSFGRVRSWWHRGGGRRGYILFLDRPPTMLKFGVHRQGYLLAYLYRKNAKRRTFPLHRLVAIAFIDNPENLPEVNHLTGLKADCRVGALEWSTRIANQRHAWAAGLITVEMVQEGLSRTVNSNLSEAQVIEIRERRALGEGNVSLAETFNLPSSCISNITTGKTFKRTGGPRTIAGGPRRLSLDDVRAIRAAVRNGSAQSELSKQFNIVQSEISRVVNNQRRYAKMV